ncbi:hypothetical protein BpHYR1_033453, partial [Brachionus plicatilis]
MSENETDSYQFYLENKLAQLKGISTDMYQKSKNNKRKNEEESNCQSKNQKKDPLKILNSVIDHQNEQDRLIEALLLEENKKLVELVQMMNRKFDQLETKMTPKMNWSILFKKNESVDKNPEPKEKTLEKIEALEAISAFSNELSEKEKRKKDEVVIGIEESYDNDEKVRKNEDEKKMNEILENSCKMVLRRLTLLDNQKKLYLESINEEHETIFLIDLDNVDQIDLSEKKKVIYLKRIESNE